MVAQISKKKYLKLSFQYFLLHKKYARFDQGCLLKLAGINDQTWPEKNAANVLLNSQLYFANVGCQMNL